MSMEDAARVREEQAAQRRSQVRHDLDALLMIVPASTLLERWRALSLRARDLTRARRDFAAAHHPDRSANPAEANRRVGMANALIDQALQDLREQS